MYSFLFIKSKKNPEKTISYTSKKILQHLSNYGYDLSVESGTYNNLNAGWFVVKPTKKIKHSLFNTFSQNKVNILFYGDLVLPFDKNPAEKAFHEFYSNGVNSIRELNGCFSVIIIEEVKEKITICGDLFGLRRFKYYADKNNLIISTQDIPIIATGLVPIEYDHRSVYSILALDWSLNGNGIIRNIKSLHPNEILILMRNNSKIVYNPLLTDEIRIDKQDKKKITFQIDNLIDLMQKEIKIRTSEAKTVQIDLTAGKDTRAVFGLTLSVIGEKTITSNTLGSKKSSEVKTASIIAKMYNIQHSFIQPEFSNIKTFDRHSKLLAFAANGDTTSLRAVHPFPDIQDCHIPKFNGIGTGIYYRPLLHKEVHNLSNKDIISFILRKNKIDRYKIDCKVVQKDFSNYLIALIEKYSTYTGSAGDLLNDFFLYERMSIWGSIVQKSNWNLREFSPFASSQIIKMNFQLPLLYNLTYPLHKEIIKRYIPKAYNIPINNNPFIRFRFFSMPDRIYNQLFKLQRNYYRVQNRLMRWKIDTNSISEIRSNLFAEQLHDYIKNLVISINSISSMIIGKENLRKILEDHINKTQDNSLIIGKLITIENYRKLIEDIMFKKVN